jgi:uncharacterized protein YbcI
MADRRRMPMPIGLSARISDALQSLWTQYADEQPSAVRTEISGNVVTCRLVDAVGVFNSNMAARQTHDTVRGVGGPTLSDYKKDAVAAIVGLTRQRVSSFMSSHDRDTDVATEVFTLEPSLGRGRPRSQRGGYR